MKKIIMNNNIYLLISKEDKICIIKKGNQNGFRYRVWIPIIQNQKFDQINRPLRISKVIPFIVYISNRDINEIFGQAISRICSIDEIDDKSIIYCDLNYPNQFERRIKELILELLKYNDVCVSFICLPELKNKVLQLFVDV